jgi:hypothetical protein
VGLAEKWTAKVWEAEAPACCGIAEGIPFPCNHAENFLDQEMGGVSQKKKKKRRGEREKERERERKGTGHTIQRPSVTYFLYQAHLLTAHSAGNSTVG